MVRVIINDRCERYIKGGLELIFPELGFHCVINKEIGKKLTREVHYEIEYNLRDTSREVSIEESLDRNRIEYTVIKSNLSQN